MSERAAIYPGNFDPITYGHIDIIRRARKLFSHLIVAVVAHPHKDPLFAAEERVRIAREALAEEGLDGIEVIRYDCLLIDVARERDVHAVVRGLRANSDFDYEFQMALMNRDLAPDVETVFLMTAGEYSFLSSSVVNEVKMYGGGVSSFVPPSVERALEERFSRGSS
ncbi:MAG: pantetheine-phosphate adenylyltransferase [Candidatus Bipolaricaulota bacterium]|nr:MAG: pantetheine-phosphate adenylyltransferase [Candidatus Bipolaricaulota bacterium]